MTEPAPRNSSALKNACVVRWNIAGVAAQRADGHDHVAELRKRRVGEDAFDVVLLRGDQRGDDAVIPPIQAMTVQRVRRAPTRKNTRHSM